MKKRIITGVIALAVGLLLVVLTLFSSKVVGGSGEKYTKEELTNLITETQLIKDNAHTMAESARNLGWKDKGRLIRKLQKKWHTADKEQVKYKNKLDKILTKEIKIARKAEEEKLAAEKAAKEAEEAARKAEEVKWATKAAEYPAATQIWRYMKAQGWNDYVCAGIMGNLMAEVGGQTLDIRYSLSSNEYYGMCQWSRGYSEIWGAGLEAQCEFLNSTIKYEFDTYGSNYSNNFNFSSFLNINDARQAALAFAKVYERCSSDSYEIRQTNAINAYEYFVK